MTENEERTELVNNLIYLFVHMNIIANPWLVGAGIANLLSMVGKGVDRVNIDRFVVNWLTGKISYTYLHS